MYMYTFSALLKINLKILPVKWQSRCFSITVFAKPYSLTLANNSIVAGVQYIFEIFALTLAIKLLTSAKADVPM